MQLIIESPGILVRPNLQAQLEEKFNSLNRIYDRIFKCTVILKKEKNDQKAGRVVEATVSVPGKVLFSREQSSTFEESLQQVTDNLVQQLRTYKGHQQEVR